MFNQNEQGTAVYGVTEHADLTYEEFRRYRLGYNESKKEVPRKLTVEDEVELAVAPDNLDWREKPGVVTEVKNQGELVVARLFLINLRPHCVSLPRNVWLLLGVLGHRQHRGCVGDQAECLGFTIRTR